MIEEISPSMLENHAKFRFCDDLKRHWKLSIGEGSLFRCTVELFSSPRGFELKISTHLQNMEFFHERSESFSNCQKFEISCGFSAWYGKFPLPLEFQHVFHHFIKKMTLSGEKFEQLLVTKIITWQASFLPSCHRWFLTCWDFWIVYVKQTQIIRRVVNFI